MPEFQVGWSSSTLRVGDIVNPFIRPAGILVPSEAGRLQLVAGFNQLEQQVIKVGMTAEVTCISKPWTIIPMVVTQVQDYIAAGQVKTSEVLVDAQQVMRARYVNGLPCAEVQRRPRWGCSWQ